MAKNEVSCTAEGLGSWVMHRPDIKVVDCTIRDGGLVNKFCFEDSFVKAVYQTCIAAGIDYMELGYKASKTLFSPAEYGCWRFCEEEDMRRIIGDNDSNLKLSVMVDVGRTEKEDVLPKEKSIFDLVRVATYIHQIPQALDLVKDAHDKGYETTVNLMAVSLVREKDLDAALEALSRAKEVNVIYLVDSFGTLYSEQIQDLTRKYLSYASNFGKRVGIHAHNNQQLAYANTIESLILGTSYLDATIFGLGRGAGNCHLELLLGFLRNPKYKLRPVIQCIQDYFVPLKKQVSWGFDIPYMLTGQLNLHPREAIHFLDSDERELYLKFHDEIMES